MAPFARLVILIFCQASGGIRQGFIEAHHFPKSNRRAGGGGGCALSTRIPADFAVHYAQIAIGN